MKSSNRGSLTLQPSETFEIYENRRFHSPKPTMNNYNSQQQSANYNSQQSANYNLQQQQSSNYNLQQHKFANVPPKQYHQQSRQQQYNNIPHDQHIHINTHPLELEITPKRKFPLVWIVVTAVCVPILIMICMFGAVWMQELGFLR